MSPEQVDKMSLWQYLAALDGWNRANGSNEKPGPPSDDDFDRVLLADAQAELARKGA